MVAMVSPVPAGDAGLREYVGSKIHLPNAHSPGGLAVFARGAEPKVDSRFDAVVVFQRRQVGDNFVHLLIADQRRRTA
jgi:hypothetical protein